jgi:hypothetical protein
MFVYAPALALTNTDTSVDAQINENVNAFPELTGCKRQLARSRWEKVCDKVMGIEFFRRMLFTLFTAPLQVFM